PPGTQVALAVTQTEAGAVEFVVEDEGPGFAPELLECAFAQGGTSPGRAGLGLSSVRRVVEAAGGASQLERRDRGTRVVLQVPQLDRGL
ncbi:MAG: ATP-binding protein, partial [Thermoleophilia bacterium]|nr:ATP-binding protein [Thermoleophilia bacterium]